MKKLTTEDKKTAIEVIEHAYERRDRDRDRIYKGLDGFIEMITAPDSVDRAELKLINSTYKLKRLLDETDEILKALKN